MKKFTANISRITITFSKFLIMIMLLSSSGTPVKADDAFTYLKCGTRLSQKLQWTHISIATYNVRTKKFHEILYEISAVWRSTWIYAGGLFSITFLY